MTKIRIRSAKYLFVFLAVAVIFMTAVSVFAEGESIRAKVLLEPLKKMHEVAEGKVCPDIHEEVSLSLTTSVVSAPEDAYRSFLSRALPAIPVNESILAYLADGLQVEHICGDGCGMIEGSAQCARSHIQLLEECIKKHDLIACELSYDCSVECAPLPAEDLATENRTKIERKISKPWNIFQKKGLRTSKDNMMNINQRYDKDIVSREELKRMHEAQGSSGTKKEMRHLPKNAMEENLKQRSEESKQSDRQNEERTETPALPKKGGEAFERGGKIQPAKKEDWLKEYHNFAEWYQMRDDTKMSVPNKIKTVSDSADDTYVNLPPQGITDSIQDAEILEKVNTSSVLNQAKKILNTEHKEEKNIINDSITIDMPNKEDVIKVRPRHIRNETLIKDGTHFDAISDKQISVLPLEGMRMLPLYEEWRLYWQKEWNVDASVINGDDALPFSKRKFDTWKAYWEEFHRDRWMYEESQMREIDMHSSFETFKRDGTTVFAFDEWKRVMQERYAIEVTPEMYEIWKDSMQKDVYRENDEYVSNVNGDVSDRFSTDIWYPPRIEEWNAFWFRRFTEKGTGVNINNPPFLVNEFEEWKMFWYTFEEKRTINDGFIDKTSPLSDEAKVQDIQLHEPVIPSSAK